MAGEATPLPPSPYFRGGLLPRPPPDFPPVVLGPLWGRGADLLIFHLLDAPTVEHQQDTEALGDKWRQKTKRPVKP